MNRNKKAQSEYLSWIMIFGLVISLSYVLYNWSIEQATIRSEEIQQRTDPILCSEIGISVEGSCQKYDFLEMNITNTGELEIQGFALRFVGIHPDENDYIQSEVIFQKLITGNTEKIKVLKKGTISHATIVPLAKKKDKNIYCEEQAVVREQGELKQC